MTDCGTDSRSRSASAPARSGRPLDCCRTAAMPLRQRTRREARSEELVMLFWKGKNHRSSTLARPYNNPFADPLGESENRPAQFGEGFSLSLSGQTPAGQCGRPKSVRQGKKKPIFNQTREQGKLAPQLHLISLGQRSRSKGHPPSRRLRNRARLMTYFEGGVGGRWGSPAARIFSPQTITPP